ncbi:MAG TPA: hypothetical protein VGF79_14035 [Bacteroidia bacterium]
MKKIQPLFLVFLIQVALIWLIPVLSVSNFDKIALNSGCLLFLIIFSFGLMRLLNTGEISQSKFNAKFFGSMGLRMLTGLGTIGIYLAISPIVNKVGTIFLLISYFVYMGFEIRIILHKLRTDSEKSKNADNARK